jgi:SnoaL-like domain
LENRGKSLTLAKKLAGGAACLHSMNRSTIEVIDDHLKRRDGRDLDGDLKHNYAPDVLLLCEHGPMHGRDAVRKSAEQLAKQIPGASFEYLKTVVEKEYALIFWRAESRSARAEHGVDSFVVRDGLIVMQSIAYVLQSKN